MHLALLSFCLLDVLVVAPAFPFAIAVATALMAGQRVRREKSCATGL